MSDKVNIKFKSDRLVRALQASEYHCYDMYEVWDDIGHRLTNSVQQNFDDGGRPDPWKPISSKRLLQKARPLGTTKKTKGGKKYRSLKTKRGTLRKKVTKGIANDKVLVDSGRLKASITHRAYNNGVKVGTNLKYAAIHHFGGEAGRKSARVKIPARPFVMVQEDDEEYMADQIEKHILKPLK